MSALVRASLSWPRFGRFPIDDDRYVFDVVVIFIRPVDDSAALDAKRSVWFSRDGTSFLLTAQTACFTSAVSLLTGLILFVKVSGKKMVHFKTCKLPIF